MKTTNTTLVTFLITFFTTLIISIQSLAQCPSGAIGVTGSGCGCLSGCNLTSLGGPNCSPSVSGNCSAGQVNMLYDIPVPSGCTITVNAIISNRAGGCTASGADGGDQLKVDVPGGSKSFQTGSSNATLSDTYVLTGPGTIRISGTANRADEIITYSASSSGAMCVNCLSSLPVELLRFEVTKTNEAVVCNWETASELNNDYFLVERSSNGIDFEVIGMMNGAGTSTQIHTYTLYDSSPILGAVSYYRLLQVDSDGTKEYSELRAINFSKTPTITISPNPSNGTFIVSGKQAGSIEFSVSDILGNYIAPTQWNQLEDQLILQYSDLPEGMYLLTYLFNEELRTEKISVTR